MGDACRGFPAARRVSARTGTRCGTDRSVKTELTHLPQRHQGRLARVVNAITRTAEVEMVILFGSFARGDFVEDPVGGYFSDYDILVVVKSTNRVDKPDTWSAAEQRAQKEAEPTEVNLIVHSIGDVNEQIEKERYFFTDIRKEGIMLHDSGQFQLAEPKAPDPEKRREMAEKDFERWFESARRYWEVYEFCLGRGHWNEAAFALHQTTERYYTTVLVLRNNSSTTRQ